MWNEDNLVASSQQIGVKLFRNRGSTARKRNKFHDEDTSDENMNKDEDEYPELAHFRKHIFYVVLHNVIGGLTVRFYAA